MACNFHSKDEDKNIVVFDFGGGTFDISILCGSEGVLDVQATRGDMRLGGLDLDNIIMEMCETKVYRELTLKNGGQMEEDDIVPPAMERMIRRRLRHTCEKAKMTLSIELNAMVRVEKIVGNHVVFNDHDFEMEINRTDYEEAAQEVFARLQEPVEKALEDAQMSKDEIDEIVIVGGSTRTPWVRQWLKDYFMVDDLNEGLNADEGVAYGAAIMAGIIANQLHMNSDKLEPQDKFLLLPDEAPDSETKPEVFGDGQNDNNVNSHQENRSQAQASLPRIKGVIVSDIIPLSIGISAWKTLKDKTKIQFHSVLIKQTSTIPVSYEKMYRTSIDD